jgi:putative nucleotidyltransferase with HDIG domain
MGFTVDQLIREAGDLPPMPQAAQRALSLIRQPETSATQVAGVLAVDQVLTGLVLRWANSAYYGLQNRVSTVQQAVMVLGLHVVRDLLLASAVAPYLNRSLPGYDLKRGDLWRHSLGVAIGAKWVVERRGWKFGDEAYHAGLLCDIGKLAFEKLLRGLDISRIDWLQGSFLDSERAHFGIDHAMLGAEMARRWRLPEELIGTIQFHHNPSGAQNSPALVASVHIADAAMMMMGVGIGTDGLRYGLDANAVNRLNLSEFDMIALVEHISAQIELAEAFIGVEGTQPRPV